MRLDAKVTRAGDRGLFVQLPEDVSSDVLVAVTEHLHDRFAPSAAIAGHSSVLLLFDRELEWFDGELLLEVEPAVSRAKAARHTIPVSFDERNAPDLEDVLAQLTISRDEFVRQLTSVALRVRFRGFLPGFAYLDGLPDAWNLQRRATSRTRVPQGSLGLAAGMAGFYPSDSPGGWNVVGRASSAFWDPWRNPPALFAPGDLVRIEAVAALPAPVSASPARSASRGTPVATCVTAGQRSLIVGPPNLARYAEGLPPSGAFDPLLAARANSAVGNPPEAAVLECTLVGPELRFEAGCRVAWEGSAIRWEKNGETIDGRVIDLRPGDGLRVGRLTDALRGWLAVSGGLAIDAAVCDAAPVGLASGDALRSSECALVDANPLGPLARYDARTLSVSAGPHTLSEPDRRKIAEREWIVTPSLDRTGIRLQPAGARISAPASVPTCGMQRGTVQLHPNGDLVIMGPDHPITGGYLQPFTVITQDLWKVAQLQPGDRIQWHFAG
ncbi:MAG: carboxyltransferase domain-containing protein [Thermoanaerobaculia bacterium]|nr:carboxyltransferase domain-containing protein [Thermoanaerobaculia bacterium]